MSDLPLDRFQPVPLAEVLMRAEYLTRVDRKYVLNPEVAVEVLQALDAGTEVLEIDGRRLARYESVYFDTPDLDTYRMCVQQRRRRVKIRTRSYLDSHTVFLEAKTRSGYDLTVKDRIAHGWPERLRLDATARSFAADAFRGVGQDPHLADLLTTALSTHYRRATLLSPDDGGRLTIDTDLSWQLPDGRQLSVDGLVILETKSAGPALPVDRLLWRAGCRPTSISKFATGLAALRPDLPHNRWARVLRDRFACSPKETQCAAV